MKYKNKTARIYLVEYIPKADRCIFHDIIYVISHMHTSPRNLRWYLRIQAQQIILKQTYGASVVTLNAESNGYTSRG